MATLRIYNDIDCQDNKFWYQWCGGDCVCFQDIDKFASAMPENDDTIDMRLFCNGGSVVEGWAIYDRLRQSGKKITCIIEGKAASMATIIMLAAPKENRKAYENASLLLHNPYIPGWCLGDQLNARELENKAEEMRMWQTRMVDAYVNRCGCDREEIQALMDKNMWIDTKESIRLGLIAATIPAISASASNSWTNFINSKQKKPKAMAKGNEEVKVKASLLDKALAKLGLKQIEDIENDDTPQGSSSKSDDVKAMELNTSDGQTITVEREEGDPQVGDAASPDGTFEMPDGKTITIKDGVITDIEGGDDNGSASTDGDGTEGHDGDDTVAKLKVKVEALTNKVADLQARLTKAERLAKSNEDMRILNAVKMAGGARKVLAGFASSYVPEGREPSVNDKEDGAMSREQGKNAILANLKKMKKSVKD